MLWCHWDMANEFSPEHVYAIVSSQDMLHSVYPVTFSGHAPEMTWTVWVVRGEDEAKGIAERLAEKGAVVGVFGFADDRDLIAIVVYGNDRNVAAWFEAIGATFEDVSAGEECVVKLGNNPLRTPMLAGWNWGECNNNWPAA